MIKERKANRMKGYDYSTDNLYFVTICVHDRINCFGEIHVGTGRDLSNNINDQSNNINDLSCIKQDNLFPENQRNLLNLMVLNEYGKIAEQQWYWLSEQYRYVKSHAFVVMPNHIHGIIEINRDIVGTGCDLSNNNDDIFIGTGRDLSLPKIKSLYELMGAYKTTVSKQIHLLKNNDNSQSVITFSWQRSFHDHIIRDDISNQKIFNYIINNPQKWVEDKFYENGK